MKRTPSLFVPQRSHAIHQLCDLVPGGALLVLQSPPSGLLYRELLLQMVHSLLQPLVACPLLRIAPKQPLSEHLIPLLVLERYGHLLLFLQADWADVVPLAEELRVEDTAAVAAQMVNVAAIDARAQTVR